MRPLISAAAATVLGACIGGAVFFLLSFVCAGVFEVSDVGKALILVPALFAVGVIGGGSAGLAIWMRYQ